MRSLIHSLYSNMFRSSYTPIWQDFLQKNLGISYAVMPLNAALFQSVVGWSELIVCLLFSISIVCDIIGFYSVTFIAASLATALMIGATYTDYLRYCNCVDKSLVGIDECKFEQMSSILLGINIFLVLMKIPLKSKRKTN